MTQTQTHPDAAEDEIRRQLDVLVRERWPRIALTGLAFALSTVFVPVWVAVLAALVDVVGEIAGMRLMVRLNPARDRERYRLSILSVFCMEASYAFIAALIWVQHAPHAQIFALGMVLVTMIHLCAVRSIHLPYGIAGTAAVALAVLISNTVYWVDLRDWNGLVISSIAAVGGIGYMLTAMISNHNLHRASARDHAAAQAANAEKSRFLARMSHELRTPLNAIIGYGVLEQRNAATPASAERLTTIVDSARGLATMLDDILDLSAIKTGRFPLRDQDIDLRAELGRTITLLSEQFREAGVALTLTVAPDVPGWGRLDPQRLRQCLTNLLNNALRHAQARRVNVTVSGRPSQAAPERFMLSVLVADDGRGIDEADRQRVFEPFSQGRDAMQGTGLGLSICRAIAEQMGGRLQLMHRSRGSAFRLDLPCIVASPAPDVVSDALQMPDLGGRTILIVDDIATNRLVAAAYLAPSGARTLEADSGEAALRMMARDRVDLVLLDMNMPGMSGLETFQRLRAAQEGRPRVPVIAMTADAGDRHRQNHLEQGLDDHLPKPIDPQRLAAMLRQHLAATIRDKAG